jgi:two-component system, NarL family, sensor kinase
MEDIGNQDLTPDFGPLQPAMPCAEIEAPRPRSNTDPVGIFQQLVNGLPEQAALIDLDDWRILVVNEAWRRTATLNGFSDFRPGANYREEIAKVAENGHDPARATLEALDEIKLRKRNSFRLVYEGGGRQAGRKFEARLTVKKVGGRRYLTVMRYDITELVQLRSMRAGFNEAMMKVQEEERRRLGRELHDSGTQLLVALSLSLARLKHVGSDKHTAAVTEEMEGLLLEVQKEFRAISYLAHPPQLETLGLVGAVRALTEGFGKRAGLEAAFRVEGTVRNMSHEADHAMFRVAQEALSNVHRHAGASKVEVRLIGRQRMLHLAVADDGRGIPADIGPGVGLMGMRSRMRELGGRLSIRKGSPGAIVLASLPLPPCLTDSAG